MPVAGAAILDRFEFLRDRWLPQILEISEEVISNSTTEYGSLLRQMADYHTATGGKRLRAVLPLLIAESLGADPARLLPFAAACEMLHNASLVHDDIQDEDFLRRGRPAVWKKFGIAQAINLGDAMIGWTFLLMDRIEADPPIRERVTRRLLLEMLRVIQGQVEELGMRSRLDVQMLEYMRMVESKTSALFALPLCGAALLSGGGEGLEQGLLQAAEHIGVLYQVQDDIADVYGSRNGDGRSNDIGEGKRSILVVHCMQAASYEDSEWLRAVLSKAERAATQREIAHAIDLFEQYGSLSFAFEEIERRRSAALNVPILTEYPALLAILEQACSMFLAPVDSLRRTVAPHLVS